MHMPNNPRIDIDGFQDLNYPKFQTWVWFHLITAISDLIAMNI